MRRAAPHDAGSAKHKIIVFRTEDIEWQEKVSHHGQFLIL